MRSKQIQNDGCFVSGDLASLRAGAGHYGVKMPAWSAFQLRGVDFLHVEWALQVAFQTARTPEEVWQVAMSFLNEFDKKTYGHVCAKIALKEAMNRPNRCLDWSSVVLHLQRLFENLGGLSEDKELQDDLTKIIQQQWEVSRDRPTFLPEVSVRNMGLLLLGKAITFEPHQARFVAFEGKSDLAWLRLAAVIGCELYALA